MADVDASTAARLAQWENQIEAQIARGDGKAMALLGWTGTALALGTTVLAGQLGSWKGLPGLLTGAGLLALGACVVVLVLAIRPRTHGPTVYGSFIGVARASSETLLGMAGQAADRDAAGSAEHLRVLAGIADAKYARVRQATGLLLVSLALLVAGAITAAI